jgi:DNA ligase (NAD+)
VGERASQILAEHFGSLRALMAAPEEELKNISGIGPEAASSIIAFFNSPLNAAFLEDLTSGVLGISPSLEERRSGGPLAGKSFVLTGTLPGMTRSEAKARIQANGGKVLSSISKEADYVLAGDAAGQKLARAHELGLKVISEEEFQDLLDGSAWERQSQ